ncbi:MAG: FtsX-like permease family protein [Kordiimonadaceae bacterium]|jgi:putative ABC transport system permease protein|nr:FtsX-like permease family protein [Kordiimonadaceae bacterium]MBT6037043.1 FtsX-like permease family protein [Kordiimonadaceae bacterium]MBT6330738.1 FtsX-like permease family protein [Kordiimonadaceae bacterium]MBT7583491.1 FtsX-like permease family protein [Kordiimonadaceae bacterium]
MILANYLTASWRHMSRHKLFSLINVLGLAIGLAAVILIALFVRDELSYDDFWSNADNIYRTEVIFKSTGREDMEFVQTPGPVIHAFRKDFPQIEHAARLWRNEPTLIQDGNIFTDEITLVDPEIINIFDFEVVEGDLEAALRNNNGLVFNETMAEKYFKDTSPIGKTITIDLNWFVRDYVVMAVIKDMPTNSQLAIKSMVLIVEEDWIEVDWIFHDWTSLGSHFFYTVPPGTKIAEINDQMPEFVDRNVPKRRSDPAYKISSGYLIKSVNIRDLHLKSTGSGEYRVRGSMTTVISFSAIASLILIIALINFINLSTARASQRAKEVSLRKVVGASRKDLIVQFLGESIILTIIAFLISVVMVELALPIYNETLVKELSLSYQLKDIVIFSSFVLIVGILSAIYPALVLSSYRPAEVLKANKSSESVASTKLRMALVIIQFSVSISLFVSSAVVYGQTQYAKNMDLGFNEENLLVIDRIYRGNVTEKLPTLVNEFKRIPGVSNVSWSNFVPGHMNENNTAVRRTNMAREDALPVGVRRVGYDFFKTSQTALLAGREFDINRNDGPAEIDDDDAGKDNSKASIIINQSTLRNLDLGSPEDAIGVSILRGDGDSLTEYEVIGVIPDLHLESLRKSTRSEIYTLRLSSADAIFVRFAGEPQALVEEIDTIWTREADGIPLEYEFLTDAIAGQYQSEQGQTIMLSAFTGLAIFIACLGLYGLASFMVDRRKKEIGIRKVMGASSTNIVRLMLWQFSKPVIVANLIAWPFSYFVMSAWLEGFVYRIESFEIIIYCFLAGIAALILSWVTVANNTYLIAMTNPIKALRDE